MTEAEEKEQEKEQATEAIQALVGEDIFCRRCAGSGVEPMGLPYDRIAQCHLTMEPVTPSVCSRCGGLGLE